MEQDKPMSNSDPLSYTLSSRLWDLCETLDEEVGLKNGTTALYWHIISIISQHAKEE